MQPILGIDIYPINRQAIPKLFAYAIQTISGDPSAIGGKLSYRLKKQFGGNWAWCGRTIIGDLDISRQEFDDCLKELWAKELDLHDVHLVDQLQDWEPSAREISDFVARGIMSNFQMDIRKILATRKQTFHHIQVTRDYAVRGTVVSGAPAIAITVFSSISHAQNLMEYAAGLPDHREIVGLMVAVSEKGFRGEVLEVCGCLCEHRDWLLSKSNDEYTRACIQRAPDHELTVKIGTRTSKYMYIASMLRPVVRFCDLKKFCTDSRQVIRALRLTPTERATMVQEVANIGIRNNIIHNRCTSINASHNFLSAQDISFVPEIRVGNGQVIPAGQRIFPSLQRYGLYQRAQNLNDPHQPIKIGIISALRSDEVLKKIWRQFLVTLKTKMNQLGFPIESIGDVEGNRFQKLEAPTWSGVEKAVDFFEPYNPDILLVFFPGEPRDEFLDEEFDDIYYALKACAIRRGIQSQVVYEDTLSEPYAIENIILGILAKTGNIPFVLARPLPYADVVVGIDIARKQKKKLPGSINVTAIARIYFHDGQFLRYTICDAPIDGETIPPNILRSLFPLKEFQGKRVVIHRDGLFRGDEKSVLYNWASEIQAEFLLVEVIKSGSPRIYQKTKELEMPPKGTMFKLSNSECFLVSSLPPFKGTTPRPIHIRTHNGFPIEHAAHSVLSLTLLHYGSVREPRLPVSIHYGDKISGLAIMGIKPQNMEGAIPFWL